MQVEQLSTTFPGDRNLLAGLRRSLADADEAVLCVAFASRGGIHLLRDALAPICKREGVLLLVTTTFGTTTAAGLQLARDLGVDVRVMNPTGGTYHPKVYVARTGDRVDAIVGSANLTNGLVANVEMATRLSGEMREPELARTLAWARDQWHAPGAAPWVPAVGAIDDEHLAPVLLQAIGEPRPRQNLLRNRRQRAPQPQVEI
jgi:HKD family nuclease